MRDTSDPMKLLVPARRAKAPRSGSVRAPYRQAPSLDYLATVARPSSSGSPACSAPAPCARTPGSPRRAAGETERIKFLVAFRPGLISPTLAAAMASTYQRLSGGG